MFQSLKEMSQSNPFSQVWWYRLFQYFEEHVSGTVPRNYQLPVSLRSLQWSRGVKYSKLDTQWHPPPPHVEVDSEHDFHECCFDPREMALLDVAPCFLFLGTDTCPYYFILFFFPSVSFVSTWCTPIALFCVPSFFATFSAFVADLWRLWTSSIVFHHFTKPQFIYCLKSVIQMAKMSQVFPFFLKIKCIF